MFHIEKREQCIALAFFIVFNRNVRFEIVNVRFEKMKMLEF